MIEFEDFAKLDLRVGEIVSVENGQTKINCGDKELSTSIQLGTKKGDKIVIGVTGNKVFPLAASTPDHKTVSLITPDQDVEPGCTVG